MKKKKTIVWITIFPHPIYGTLLGAMKKRFPHFSFCAIAAKRFEALSWGEPNIQWIALDSLRFERFAGMEYLKGFEKKLEEMRPDVIICNLYYSFSSFQAYRFARKNDIPLIITIEEKDSDGLLKKMLHFVWDVTFGKQLLDYAEKILALSRASQKFMESKMREREKLLYFPAGVDTNVFTKDQQKIYAPGGTIRLLMVASMVACKDHFALLMALRHLTEQGFDKFKLNLIGKGPLKGEIEAMIQTRGLRDKVRILDPIAHGEMTTLYQWHDVLMLPSKKEAVGIVVPEAMACGLAAIVSDGAGAKDYVQDGVNGFIFRAGDWKDLADKIFMISRMDLAQMGNVARKHVVENFSIHTLVQGLDNTLFA